MSKKKNLKHASFSDVKLTDAEIKKFAKKHTVFSKGKVIASVIGGVALVGAGVGSAVYFGVKGTAVEGSGQIIIDPTASDTATILDKGTDGDGNQIKEVCDSKKAIAGIKVTVGNTLLKENEDYRATPENSTVSKYRVLIFKKTLEKYKNKGSFKITPIYDTVDKVVITFNSNGGTKVDPIQVAKGSKATAPTNPTKDGYSFLGWYVEGTSTKFNFNEAVNENVSLIAKWHLDESIEGLSFEYDETYNGLIVWCDTHEESALPSKLSIPQSIEGIPVVGIGNANLREEHNVPSADPVSPNQVLTANSVNAERTEYETITDATEGAFSDTNLTEVEIPEGVIYIDDHAFARCYKLKKVTLPKSCTFIGARAFLHCYALSNIDFSDGLRSIGKEAFLETSLEEVILPDTVEEVGYGAFALNSNLKKVHLSTKLKSLSQKLFHSDKDLKEINIPSSVSLFGNLSLYNCKGLLTGTVNFEDKTSLWGNSDGSLSYKQIIGKLVSDPVYFGKVTATTGDGFVIESTGKMKIGEEEVNTCTVYYNPQSALVEGQDTITVNETYEVGGTTYYVTGISDFCFERCVNEDIDGITKVILPKTITSIGNYAFAYTTIREISFSESGSVGEILLKKIGDRAFALTYDDYCSEARIQFNSQGNYDIYLPENLEEIGDQAFSFRYTGYYDDQSEWVQKYTYIPASVTTMTYGRAYYQYSYDPEGKKIKLDGDGYNSNPFFFFYTDKIEIEDSENPKFYVHDNDGLYSANGDLMIQLSNAKGYDDQRSGYTMPESIGSVETMTVNKYSFDSDKYYMLETTVGFYSLNVKFNASVNYISSYIFTMLDSRSTIDQSNPYYKKDSSNVIYKLDDEGNETSLESFLYIYEDSQNGDDPVQIEIPTSVTQISELAFYNKDNFELTNFGNLTNLTTIGSLAFYNAEFANSIDGPGADFVVPSSVTYIGGLAFSGSNITEFDLKIDSEAIANTILDTSLLFGGRNEIYLNNSISFDNLESTSILKTYYEVADNEEQTVEGYTKLVLRQS